MGAADLSGDPLVSEPVDDLGAPARCVMVGPDASGKSAGGDGEDERPRHGSGMTCFEEGLGSPGTTAVGPGREGSSVLESPSRTASCSRERGEPTRRSREDAADAESRHGLRARKGVRVETPGAAADPACPRDRRESNPPRERETPRAELWRERQSRVLRISSVGVAGGARNPRRGDPVPLDR